MSLKQTFERRVQRATLLLDDPKAGPTEIKFSSQDLSDPQTLAQLHGRFPRKTPASLYLYQLSLVGNDVSAASVRGAFRDALAKGVLAMSRDNAAHPDSRSLYVGASADLHERFRTHLGRGKGTTTWAMYLAAWAIPLNTRFAVEYYSFKDARAEDVELIEGVLWDALQPLFGKKGGK